MDHKLSYKLFWIVVIVGLVIFIIAELFRAPWFGIAGGVLVIIAAAQAAFFWRCPDCGQALPLRGKRPDYCPYCGHDLGFADSEES